MFVYIVCISSSGGHVTRKEPGPEQVCLGLAGSVWVLDFVQEGFHSKSSGDFEIRCITVGDSEPKKEPRIEAAAEGSLGSALLRLLRNIMGKKWATLGCADSLRSKSPSGRSELRWGCDQLKGALDTGSGG